MFLYSACYVIFSSSYLEENPITTTYEFVNIQFPLLCGFPTLYIQFLSHLEMIWHFTYAYLLRQYISHALHSFYTLQHFSLICKQFITSDTLFAQVKSVLVYSIQTTHWKIISHLETVSHSSHYVCLDSLFYFHTMLHSTVQSISKLTDLSRNHPREDLQCSHLDFCAQFDAGHFEVSCRTIRKVWQQQTIFNRQRTKTVAMDRHTIPLKLKRSYLPLF